MSDTILNTDRRTTIFLPSPLMKAARKKAKGQMRSLSNYIATLIGQDVEVAGEVKPKTEEAGK